jgi:hypothetical protein
MSDTNVGGGDNPASAATPNADTQGGDNHGTAPTQTGEPAGADNSQRYLGTYKTRDDAEKGYTELQSAFTRASMEKAEMAARLDMLEKQVNAMPAGKTRDDYEARVKQVITEVANKARKADDPWETVVADMVQIQRGMVLDGMEGVEKKYQERIAQLEQKLQDYDPAIAPHREEINAIMKETGVDKATAAKFFEKFVKGKESTPAVSRPTVQRPGTPRGGSTGDDVPEQVELPAAMVARVHEMGLPPENTKRILDGMKKDLARSRRSN